MTDMLVKLYDLPDITAELARLKTADIHLRRVLSVERAWLDTSI